MNRRVARPRARLAVSCRACGRPSLDEPPQPPITPTPEMDRVFLPILTAIVSRTPPAPDPCPRCARPADPNGWEWPLRFATPAEVRALKRAVDLFVPGRARGTVTGERRG